MNKHLLQINRESIFEKNIDFFRKIFLKEKSFKSQNLKEDIVDTQTKETGKFITNLKVDGNCKTLALQKNLKDKKIEISDLTDKELDEMIDLYKKQIEEKDKMLKLYRKKLLGNK